MEQQYCVKEELWTQVTWTVLYTLPVVVFQSLEMTQRAHACARALSLSLSLKSMGHSLVCLHTGILSIWGRTVPFIARHLPSLAPSSKS